MASAISTRPSGDNIATTQVTGSVLSASDVQVDFGTGTQHAGVDVLLSVNGEPIHASVTGSSFDFTLGSTVSVEGEAVVIADYEWDAFGLTETRLDWIVRELRNLGPGDFLMLLERAGRHS